MFCFSYFSFWVLCTLFEIFTFSFADFVKCIWVNEKNISKMYKGKGFNFFLYNLDYFCLFLLFFFFYFCQSHYNTLFKNVFFFFCIVFFLHKSIKYLQNNFFYSLKIIKKLITKKKEENEIITNHLNIIIVKTLLKLKTM